MSQFIDVVSDLIYGSAFTPNHRAWESANAAVPPASAPTTAWIDHHLVNMLPRFEAWLASTNQPPIVPWDGATMLAWETTAGFAPVALGPLDGSFTGITTRAQLSRALHQRQRNLGYRTSYAAGEFRDAVKAPFSHRYWSYLKWAQLLLRRFEGQISVRPGTVFDRDGTILSSLPFLQILNELHWNFHDHGGHHGLDLSGITTPAATQNTPRLDSTAGQGRTAIATDHSAAEGSEFFRFHRDHVNVIYNGWLRRKGLPGAPSYNLRDGWPLASIPTGGPADRTVTTDPGAPGTWVEPDSSPFVNTETGDTDSGLRTAFSALDTMGISNPVVNTHGTGHNNNADITTPFQNNYVPRFFSWHEWLDLQWYARAPRLGGWDPATRLKRRVFEPVLPSSAAWPGLRALSIVRDPTGAADQLSPPGAVSAINFATGAGTLRLKTLARDSYDRVLRLTIRADVFDDATSTTTPTETVNVPALLIGPGQATALGAEVFVNLAFASAFRSSSPAFDANAPVGFVNSRITISARLEVDGSTEPGFVFTDRTELLLVKEDRGPQIDLYFNNSTFGEGQVAALMGAGGATFANALVVTVQDRTSDGAPITWPAEVHPAVRGLIKGFVPCSGLFDAAAHAPRVTFADGAITAVPVAGSPFKEDASLPEHLPQRFTYRYDIRFAPGFGGFGAIAAGGFADVAVDVGGYDRSNNRSSASGAIRLLRSANPYMVDGDPAWLSADTRVFRVEEGASLLGVTLAAGSPDPNAFIQSVLGRFRTNALGASDFDGLPADAALVFFPDVRNVPAGTTRRVFNFALAKVRLRGAAGADDVRAFFRLFRYASPNLVFDPATGYRTHPQAGIERIPLMGFEGTTPGANAISVPFFAERRVTFDVGMQTQTDPANIGTLPPGGTAERYLYFGAFLDINQDAPNARLPLTFVSTAAEANGFTAAQVAPIRDIFYDAHVCMAVELHHPGDVTPTGADPFNSDNLAQRNLVVLKAANPGDPATRQVQHSFEIFTGGRRGAKQRPQALTHAQHEEDDAPRERLEFTTPERIDRMVDLEVAAERFAARHGGHGAHDEDDARAAAVRDRVVQQFPLVFDSAEWTERTDLFDELLIQWNDLPAESVATVHLPGVNCEDVVNLRNLRHAPGDVRIVDSETLELDIGGATYLPVPAGLDARVPGLITIELPDGIRAGQRWTVDVLQLRGGEQRTTGAFQLEVLAAKSAAFAEDEVRLLELLVRRLALLPKAHAWRPVLEARVRHQRERARRLTEDAGDAWVDPTVWRDPGDADDADPRPIEGPRLRVVLERIRVRDDLDPFIKGRGEIALTTTVHSPDNGGKVERHRLPDDGFFRVSDRPGANELELERPIFEGYVARDLRVAIAGGEHDTFDRDDVLGKYTRLFHGDPDEWLGSYGPGDEGPVEPEDMLSWQLWYRIERA